MNYLKTLIVSAQISLQLLTISHLAWAPTWRKTNLHKFMTSAENQEHTLMTVEYQCHLLLLTFKSVHAVVQLWGCRAYRQMWRHLWTCAEPIRFWSLPKCSSIVSFPLRQSSTGRYSICIQTKSCQETEPLNCWYHGEVYRWVATQFGWP